MHSEIEALDWAMENMSCHSTCQNFGSDCKDLIAMIRESQACPNFSTELKLISVLQRRLQSFKISYIPRDHNTLVDSLARTARFFRKELCFFGCYILF